MLDAFSEGCVAFCCAAMFIAAANQNCHDHGIRKFCLLVESDFNTAASPGPVHTGQELANGSATTSETAGVLYLVEVSHCHCLIEFDKNPISLWLLEFFTLRHNRGGTI